MLEPNSQPSNASFQNEQTKPRPPSAEYKFTPDEMRVLRECNTESFFQRSLPLGTLLGLSTYYGVKAGYLKSHIKWGPTPKVMLAVTAGYFIGKFSYQNVCAEKFLKLPDSRLGEILRQRRRGVVHENIEPGLGASMALAPFSSVSSNEVYSDLPQQSTSLDIDSSRPAYPGLSDSNRPSLDSETPRLDDQDVNAPSAGLKTYDELRKENRSEYQKNRGVNYRGVVEPTPPPTAQRRSPASDYESDVPQTTLTGRRNKYGDIMD